MAVMTIMDFDYIPLPWQFLNFLPDPQGHGSLRPTLGAAFMGCTLRGPPPALAIAWRCAFSPGILSFEAGYWE